MITIENFYRPSFEYFIKEYADQFEAIYLRIVLNIAITRLDALCTSLFLYVF